MRKLLCAILLTWTGTLWALSPNANREQIIAELGKPSSVARLGPREILNYPKGVRIEMENGQIVSVKGLELSSEEAPPLPAEAVKAPAANAAKEEPGEPEEPPLTEAQKKQLAADEAAAEKSMAEAQEKFNKTVEDMAKSHENGDYLPKPAVFDLLNFILGLVIKTLLVVAALKLACKYWGAEIFWSGIFIIAGADVAVRLILQLVGELVLGFPTLFMADEAVASVVMFFLLKKLSINHSLRQAVTLMFTTKTFSIVVGSFLLTIILNFLH